MPKKQLDTVYICTHRGEGGGAREPPHVLNFPLKVLGNIIFCPISFSPLKVYSRYSSNGMHHAGLSCPPPLQVRESLGTVNLSICYSPDTKRLSVIILRAKDLNRGNYKETGEWAGRACVRGLIITSGDLTIG